MSDSMQVRLLSMTPDPERLCGLAAMGCYSEKNVSELSASIDDKKSKQVLRDVIKSGHHSVIEHAYFTFSLEGISRACTHQLVRHRLASYSQQSQRYVVFNKTDMVIPPTIDRNDATRKLFDSIVMTMMDGYHQLLDHGIPPEDARFLLPNAMATNIVVTMNARELHHFFAQRTCSRAQWEIRAVALKMLELACAAAPDLFKNCGPPCLNGPCPEGKRSCGQPWQKDGKQTQRQG